VTCWGGCTRLDVLAELRRRSLLPGCVDYAPRIISASDRKDDRGRIERARKNWRNTRTSASSIVANYLATRGLVFDNWPLSLRFDPNCPRPRDCAGNLQPSLPAMVALVEHVDHGPIGVHCTYLLSDGTAKADLPKEEQRACFGRIKGGAIRFGEPICGQWLVVGEGVESTLSAALPCGLPAWAALSASGIENLRLPSHATHVVIAADNDLNGRGQRAAQHAATQWLAEGRHVRIALTPRGSDFNNVITGKVLSNIGEAFHVA
jgi:putative DNA primase/helicase